MDPTPLVRIYKVRVLAAENGQMYELGAFVHEGGLWLATSWTELPSEQVRKPNRIIRMDVLAHQKLEENPEGIDYFVNTPIPTGVLLDQTPPEEAHGFVVIDKPDVAIRFPTKH